MGATKQDWNSIIDIMTKQDSQTYHYRQRRHIHKTIRPKFTT